MTNFPLYCVNWIEVTGAAIVHPIEQNAIQASNSIYNLTNNRSLPYIRLQTGRARLANITN